MLSPRAGFIPLSAEAAKARLKSALCEMYAHVLLLDCLPAGVNTDFVLSASISYEVDTGETLAIMVVLDGQDTQVTEITL